MLLQANAINPYKQLIHTVSRVLKPPAIAFTVEDRVSIVPDRDLRLGIVVPPEGLESACADTKVSWFAGPS